MPKLNEEIEELLSYDNTFLIKNFDNIDKENIIIYGAGSLGYMALDLLKKIDVNPKYIVDREHKNNIEGIEVILPSEIKDSDRKCSTFLIAISSIPYTPIYNYLKYELKCEKVEHFYDYCEVHMKNILGNGWIYPKLSQKDLFFVMKVFDKLIHDKISVNHYLQFLWWRLNRIEKINKDYPVLSNNKYFNAPCMPKLSKKENYLDCGAHFGTTIKSFFSITKSCFDNIWAFEPDEANFNILTKSINSNFYKKVFLYNIALSNEEGNSKFIDNLGFASKIEKNGDKEVIQKKIDNLNINPSIIKLHLEGYELEALYGAKETIIKSRPIIMVLADHSEDGLYKIANFLINLKDYKLYFYLHDYCGNSAIFYAIPEERYK